MSNALPPRNELAKWPPLRVYTKEKRAHWVDIQEIVYLEAAINYTWVHLTDQRRILLPYTISILEDQLPPVCFIRIHKSYLVNRLLIHRLERDAKDGVIIYLTSGISLPISRRRLPSVRRQLRLPIDRLSDELVSPDQNQNPH